VVVRLGDAAILVYAASEFVLALLLVSLNPRHRATRAFAVLIVFRGLIALLTSLGNIADDPLRADLWRRLAPYASLPTAFLVLYFLAVYPAPRRWLPSGFRGPLLFLLPALALVGLYVLDHQLYFGEGAGPRAGGLARGPLAIAVPGLRFAYLAVAIVLARDAFREPPGARRSTMLLVSAGFAPFPIVLGLVFGLSGGFAQGYNLPYLAAFALVLALPAALVALLARAATAPGPGARAPRWYLAALGCYVLATLLVMLVVSPGPQRGEAGQLLAGLTLLPLPFVTVYALLRHEMFDIRLRFRWTVKQSTLAGAFIGVFFVVSESAQQFFASTDLGPYLGIAAAGLLVFALAPLQRAAERVADAAVPGARPLARLGQEERATLYLDQVRFAWSDGRLTDDERRILDHLRERLGLSLEAAARLERQVTDERTRPAGSGV
jgi:hypothetical protein